MRISITRLLSSPQRKPVTSAGHGPQLGHANICPALEADSDKTVEVDGQARVLYGAAVRVSKRSSQIGQQSMVR